MSPAPAPAACSCRRSSQPSPPPRFTLSQRALGVLAADHLSGRGPVESSRLLAEVLDALEAATEACDPAAMREAILAARILADGLPRMAPRDREGDCESDDDGRDEPAAGAAD